METGSIKYFTDILLNQPAKAEKIFLWTLQALITLWFFSFFGFDIVSTVKNGESSLLDIIISIILFTIVWCVAWGGLIDLLLILLFYLLNPIIRFIRKALVYLIRLLLFKINKWQKPKFIWKQPINHSTFNYVELNDFLWFSSFMDRVTNSSAGSENILKILSYDKKGFIKSRINRYYNIVLLVYLANIFLNGDINLNFWTIILLGLLYVVGNIISEMIDFYDTVASKYTYYLQPVLENTIYSNFIYHALLKAPLLFDDYSIKKKRNIVYLALKDKEMVCQNQFKEVWFIPTNTDIYSRQLTKIKEKQSDILVVFLSKDNFPLYDLNKITEAGQCFIQTTDEAQLVEAIKTLRPIFLGKLKSIDNIDEKE